MTDPIDELCEESARADRRARPVWLHKNFRAGNERLDNNAENSLGFFGLR